MDFVNLKKAIRMSLAEKKQIILKEVEHADDALTEQIIGLINSYKKSSSNYTEEELKKFHASREAYLQNPSTSSSLEEAHTYIRSLKHK